MDVPERGRERPDGETVGHEPETFLFIGVVFRSNSDAHAELLVLPAKSFEVVEDSFCGKRGDG